MIIVACPIWWELRTEVLAFTYGNHYCECDLCYYGGYCIEVVQENVLHYLDELSFGVGWKITKEKVQIMQNKFKEHFWWDIRNIHKINRSLDRLARDEILCHRFLGSDINWAQFLNKNEL